MDYMNLEDPNLDFDTRAAIIARELKSSDALRNTPNPASVPGAFDSGIGRMGSVLSRAAGELAEDRALRQSAALAKEERKRGDALIAEFNKPGTKRVLRAATGTPFPMEELAPVEADEPMSELENVQRRTGIAQSMSALPRYRKMAEGLTTQLAAMPEKIQAREDAQAARAEAAAMEDRRLREISAQRIEEAARAAKAADDIKREGQALARSLAMIASGDRRFATRVGAKQQVIVDGNSSTGFRYWNPEMGAGEEAPPPKKGGNASGQSDPAIVQRMYDDITRNVDKLIDKDGNPSSALSFVAGPRARLIPKETLGQASNEAIGSLDALQKQMTMLNLAEAKKAVGQSFGSMQAQEWQKFTDLMAGLDRSLYPEQLAENIKYIREYIKNNREVLAVALGSPGVKMEARPGTGTDAAAKEARYQAWKAQQGVK